jgi:hypothetical protein
VLLSRDAWRALWGAAFVGAALGACAACGEMSAPRDGGEAGSDAGRDAAAARDAGRDAGADAGLPDDGGDPSVDVEPGWVRLEGFADRCRFERATNPAPLLEVRWEPCPFDATGCVYLAWDERFARRVVGEGTSDHDGTKGYFVVTELRDPGGPEAIQVVADTDGRVYAAWRAVTVASDSACLRRTAVGGGRVVHIAEGLGPRPGTELLYGPHRIYWSDLESASDGEHLALAMGDSIVPPGNSVDHIQTSESLIALRFNGTTQVMLYDGEGWVLHGGIHGPYGLAVRPRVVGRDAFWTAHVDGTRRVMTASMTGEPIALYEDELMKVGADGSALVWERIVEREDVVGTILATELWTSPLTTDPSAIRARQVGPRIDRPGSGGTVGEGLYAYANQDQQNAPYVTSIYLIDLANGSRRRYDLPTEPRWIANWVEWVTHDEVAVMGAGRRADGSIIDGTLFRIRLSAFVSDE